MIKNKGKNNTHNITALHRYKRYIVVIKELSRNAHRNRALHSPTTQNLQPRSKEFETTAHIIFKIE
jgi:hypothetical protein